MLLPLTIRQPILAFVSGALAVLSFSPVNWWPFAVISPLFLLILLQNRRNKAALMTAWSYGFGYFLFGVSWVYVSIHQFGGTPVPIALLLTLLFCGFLALFPMGIALILRCFNTQNSFFNHCCLFPSAWLLMEWLRSHLLTGFPWLLLGVSQTDSPLAVLAPWIGGAGLSFVCCFLAGLLWVLWQKAAIKRLIGLVFVAFALQTMPFSITNNDSSEDISVALVQGNIEQDLKWSPDYLQNTISRYVSLSAQHSNNALIVWPESAIPLPWPMSADLLQPIAEQFAARGQTLITGVPVVKGPEQYLNAIMAFGEQGGVYYKHHLVPFGEYLPFKFILNWLRQLDGIFNIPMSDFVAGELKQAPLPYKQYTFAPFICYEIAYSDSVRQALPKADFLLTISNDAWFGHSLAPYQHLQIAQMRSLETARQQLFVGNTGITAIINQQGNIKAQLPHFTSDVLTGSIQANHRVTFWVKWGDKPIMWLSMLLTLLTIPLNQRQKQKLSPFNVT